MSADESNGEEVSCKIVSGNFQIFQPSCDVCDDDIGVGWWSPTMDIPSRSETIKEEPLDENMESISRVSTSTPLVVYPESNEPNNEVTGEVELKIGEENTSNSEELVPLDVCFESVGFTSEFFRLMDSRSSYQLSRIPIESP